MWSETRKAIKRAYKKTDEEILDKVKQLGKGGSTAVTAILIDAHKLVVANVGDSRAVLCKNGVAYQLSVDHEPTKEKREIESRGGFVSNIPGLVQIIIQTFSFLFFFLFEFRCERMNILQVMFHVSMDNWQLPEHSAIRA